LSEKANEAFAEEASTGEGGMDDDVDVDGVIMDGTGGGGSISPAFAGVASPSLSCRRRRAFARACASLSSIAGVRTLEPPLEPVACGVTIDDMDDIEAGRIRDALSLGVLSAIAGDSTTLLTSSPSKLDIVDRFEGVW
jgi:hypothetical protein